MRIHRSKPALLLAAVLCAACEAQADVVAYPVDAGGHADSGIHGGDGSHDSGMVVDRCNIGERVKRARLPDGAFLLALNCEATVESLLMAPSGDNTMLTAEQLSQLLSAPMLEQHQGLSGDALCLAQNNGGWYTEPLGVTPPVLVKLCPKTCSLWARQIGQILAVDGCNGDTSAGMNGGDFFGGGMHGGFDPEDAGHL
ncbi:MAG TPA: hypothetical protein VHM19_23500 [Polyangiales bacterium]|jgi:hypothetical protein|nr:hypothetical protein [Polyangiales bacterium]